MSDRESRGTAESPVPPEEEATEAGDRKDGRFADLFPDEKEKVRQVVSKEM